MANNECKLNLDDLGDEILVEILHRLPCKPAFRFKSVSKRWNGLISGPQFLHQFISRRVGLLDSLQHHHCAFMGNPLDLLLIPRFPSEILDKWKIATVLFSLNSLLNLQDEQQHHPLVLGYSNGLLLFTIHKKPNLCYVFNLLTKNLVKLPPCPPTNLYRVGLICHPDYHIGEAYNNFYVIFIDPQDFNLYSSETGHWKRFELSCKIGFALSDRFRSCPAEYRVCHSSGVAHDRMLYFLSRRGLLVCDPFSNDISSCSIVDGPNCSSDELKGFYFNYDRCISVSCGQLRMCQATYLSYGTVNMNVWELRGFDKESGMGLWHSIHDVCVGPDVWENNEKFSGLRRGFSIVHRNCNWLKLKLEISLLALHPYNEDIIYFQYKFARGQSIFSCNLRTKTLEEVPVSERGRQESYSTFQILIPNN